MATLGRTTIGGSFSPIESTIAVIPVTMPEHGTIHSVWAYVRESTTVDAHSVVGVVLTPTMIQNPGAGYVAAGRVVSSSLPPNTSSYIKLTGAWRQFQLKHPLFLQSGTQLFIGTDSGGGSGAVECAADVGVTGDNFVSPGTTYPVVPPYTDFNSSTNRFSMYLEYVPGDTRVATVVQPTSWKPKRSAGGITWPDLKTAAWF